MTTRRHNDAGFTRIELLVVIAIIARLMAVFVPSLGRARKQAQFVGGKANLKSYGMMAFLYAGPMWSYLKGKGIHICPSFPPVAKEFGPVHPEHVASVPIRPNYDYSR